MTNHTDNNHPATLKKVNKDKVLNIKRALYAQVGALIHTLICLLLWNDGLFRCTEHELIIILGVVWTINLSFLFLISSDFSNRFKDPALTMPLVIWAITYVMFTVYFANTLRSTLLMFYLLILIFGSTKLKARQYIFVSAYGVILYIIAMFFFIESYPHFIDISQAIIELICFATIFAAFGFITSELSNLRRRLHQKNVKLNSALKHTESVSVTDELTGIKNRRYILNVLEEQRLMSERGQYVFSICMIDIDNFKNFNDTYGHLLGDNVLKAITNFISGEIRKIDYFARFGGEEFLLILPFATGENAEIISERIRKKIEKKCFDEVFQGLKITISIGVTQYNWPEDIRSLLARTDTALYAAKRNGRNKVILA